MAFCRLHPTMMDLRTVSTEDLKAELLKRSERDHEILVAEALAWKIVNELCGSAVITAQVMDGSKIRTHVRYRWHAIAICKTASIAWADSLCAHIFKRSLSTVHQACRAVATECRNDFYTAERIQKVTERFSINPDFL